jgi:hypothetical protein
MSSIPNNPHGVRQLYTPKGSYKINFGTNHQGSSRRWENPNPPMNMEMTGYFKADGDDTVSAKVHGGRHTDDNNEEGCCYIPQAPTRGGSPEYQVECPHPDNHDCPFTEDANCKGIEDWRGYKVVIWNTAQNCVYWELWEDQGNNDGSSPANQWVRVSHHTDCTGDCGEIDEPLLEPKGGSNQATWRIDVSDCQAKWTSSVEIVPGSTTPGSGGGGTPTPTPETPGGGEIPDPDQPSTTIAKEWVDVWHVAQDAGESCTTSGSITPADLEVLWDLSPPTPATYLDLFTGSNTRAGIYIRNQSSRLWNTIPKEWSFTVHKFGTPTGVIKLVEYDWNGTLQAIFEKQIGSDINVGTLTTGVDTLITIQDLDNEERIKADHVFYLEYIGGDVNNKIRVRQTDIDYLDSSDTCFAYSSTSGTWTRSPSRDLPCKIMGYPA